MPQPDSARSNAFEEFMNLRLGVAVPQFDSGVGEVSPMTMGRRGLLGLPKTETRLGVGKKRPGYSAGTKGGVRCVGGMIGGTGSMEGPLYGRLGAYVRFLFSLFLIGLLSTCSLPISAFISKDIYSQSCRREWNLPRGSGAREKSC